LYGVFYFITSFQGRGACPAFLAGSPSGITKVKKHCTICTVFFLFVHYTTMDPAKADQEQFLGD